MSLVKSMKFEMKAGHRVGAIRSALAATTMLTGCGLLASPVFAATNDELQNQIATLQYQVDQLRSIQDQEQAKMKAAIGSNKPAYSYVTGGNRFGFSSADGKNTIELTGRLHFDAGDYVNQTPADQAANGPGSQNKKLAGGVNARRARIGITGKLAGDFTYNLIYDFGNSQDTGSASAPLSGIAYQAGIENAYITYNGFNHVENLVPVAIDLGYMDVPITLDEATSSNDIMFMERDSSQIVAVTNTGGGDYRSALGLRSYKTNYWTGLFLTGPVSGANHTGAGLTSAQTGTVAGNGSTTAGAFGDQTYAVGGRATYQVLDTPDYTLHVGVNGLYDNPARGNGVATAPTLTLSDRPQIRIDPTSTLSAAINYNNAFVFGPEFAATFGQFFFQGEYFRTEVNQYRLAATNGPLPELAFNGGYIEASYSIGGRRKYNPGSGAYTGVIPDSPFSLANGGGGAWEFAARFGAEDLNSHTPSNGRLLTTTGGVAGGDQKAYALGANWYPSTNLKFMLDYTHTDVDDRYAAQMGFANLGVHVDALGARAQFSF